jgi:hypothetical protein
MLDGPALRGSDSSRYRPGGFPRGFSFSGVSSPFLFSGLL